MGLAPQWQVFGDPRAKYVMILVVTATGMGPHPRHILGVKLQDLDSNHAILSAVARYFYNKCACVQAHAQNISKYQIHSPSVNIVKCVFCGMTTHTIHDI